MPELTATVVVGGFLNVNKDAGMTSMDVVRRVKRITGQKKAGHAGTLDPDATGVLPVALGKATRFIEYVTGGRKRYDMTVRLGEATDTYDASGEITAAADASGVDEAAVRSRLTEFTGTIDQVPPMYSAIKRGGTPLYRLAREGIEVERQPRPVDVYELRLTHWDHPEFDLEVECGSGFYARSLANDLAIAVGTRGHLKRLVRTRVGGFDITDAVSLAGLEQRPDAWLARLAPIDFVLGHLPAISLNPLTEQQIRNGQPVRATPAEIKAADAVPGGEVRVYDSDGVFVATAKFDLSGPWWKPSKVVGAA